MYNIARIEVRIEVIAGILVTSAPLPRVTSLRSMMTESMTWMTPFEHSRFGRMILALRTPAVIFTYVLPEEKK